MYIMIIMHSHRVYICAVCVHKCIAAVAVAAANLLNFAAIIKLGKFYVYFVLYLC